MAMIMKTCFFLCSFAIILVSSSSSSSKPNPAVIRGAYYPSWFFTSFPPSSINTNLFTHIYYAFLAPNSLDFRFNVDASQSPLLLNFTATLRAKKPPVKTLFSVGGASEGTVLFQRMASTPSSRANFISSSIEVARKFGFDGIDLDWEFPQTTTDMENLGLLLQEWRAEVKKEARSTRRPPLLLTAAVYYSADTFLSGQPRAYPAASVGKNLDWVNIMNYDYRGSWDTSATGAHAALFDRSSNVSTSYGLRSWVRSGVPISKLNMGLPLYGRTWKLKDPKEHSVGAAAVGVGPGSGVLTYREIVEYNKENRAKVVYDAESVSTYSVAGTDWIGYDDARSVAVKIGYARSLRIRGYFFWAVHGDSKWKISTTASKKWPS